MLCKSNSSGYTWIKDDTVLHPIHDLVDGLNLCLLPVGRSDEANDAGAPNV